TPGLRPHRRGQRSRRVGGRPPPRLTQRLHSGAHAPRPRGRHRRGRSGGYRERVRATGHRPLPAGRNSVSRLSSDSGAQSDFCDGNCPDKPRGRPAVRRVRSARALFMNALALPATAPRTTLRTPHSLPNRLLEFAQHKPLGAAGAVIVLVLILVAVGAPWLAPYPFDEGVASVR